MIYFWNVYMHNSPGVKMHFIGKPWKTLLGAHKARLDECSIEPYTRATKIHRGSLDRYRKERLSTPAFSDTLISKGR